MVLQRVKLPLALLALLALASAEGVSDQESQGLSFTGLGGDGLRAAVAQGKRAAAASSPSPAAPVLAYVTPWNGGGYDLAKKHRCRLHYVAPVWFQLRAAGGAPELTGGHDVDAVWVAAVKQPCAPGAEGSENVTQEDVPGQGRAAKVLPRVIFEVGGADLAAILQQPAKAVSLLVDEAERHGFDGWVVEAWSAWAAMGVTRHPQARQATLRLLRQLSVALTRSGKRLVLAVSPLKPAPGQPAQLSEQDAAELLGFAYALSVMTYDYASPQQPGPNAPLPWVAENAAAFAAVADRLPGGSARGKVLLGIPFYGYEYVFQGKQLVAAEARTAGRFLEVLQTKAMPSEDAEEAEAVGQQQAAAAGQQCSAEEAERDGAAGSGACAARNPPSSGTRSSDALSITWLDESCEHLFRWKEAAGAALQGKKRKRHKHRLYFPTPRAIAERLAVAAKHGMGVSVWELGQGLDEFAALL